MPNTGDIARIMIVNNRRGVLGIQAPAISVAQPGDKVRLDVYAGVLTRSGIEDQQLGLEKQMIE